MGSRIEDLVDLAWDAVAERCDRRSGERIARPATVPLAYPRSESRFGEFAVLAYLERALELARSGELASLAAAFDAVRDRVRWSQNPSYTKANVGRALLDGYAYGGLAGPDSPIACEVPRAGFLLMAPRLTYQDHRHAPKETYLVMTPGAQWRLDEGEWFDVDAGELIVHRPWQMHASRTAAEPMLAFVAWLESGDRTAITI